MARCALPVLLLNLNCEMLYVIEERLVAQGVDAEKSARVRSDLVTAMFDREFIETLFKPQPMYDQAQLMSMLDHFSQASIIRLNAKSLSKLFDLMIMTVKYQFSLCKCAKEMLAVTLTHLEVVHDTLHLSQSCQQLVEHTINLVKERYGSLSTGTWQRIRHVIGCVLQDKHTRVALFQQAQYQGQDGRFHLPRTGPAAPYGCHPGKIQYGGSRGTDLRQLFRSKFSAGEENIDYLHKATRSSDLGQNLYQLARQGGIEGVTVESAGPLTQIRPATEQPAPQQLKAESERPQVLKNSNETALQGLNLLARLVGGKKEAKLFPLLLFSAHGGGDDEDDDDDVLDVDDVDANASSDALTLGGTHSVLHVEASTGRQELRDMMKDFDDADDDDDTSGSRRRPRHASDTGAGDDLLAMMDAL